MYKIHILEVRSASRSPLRVSTSKSVEDAIRMLLPSHASRYLEKPYRLCTSEFYLSGLDPPDERAATSLRKTRYILQDYQQDMITD